MADITMCRGVKVVDGVRVECSARSKCYRHVAPEGQRQSWFLNVPGEDERCKYFWPIEPNKTVDK